MSGFFVLSALKISWSCLISFCYAKPSDSSFLLEDSSLGGWARVSMCWGNMGSRLVGSTCTLTKLTIKCTRVPTWPLPPRPLFNISVHHQSDQYISSSVWSIYQFIGLINISVHLSLINISSWVWNKFHLKDSMSSNTELRFNSRLKCHTAGGAEYLQYMVV